ncbi:MAG: hypothetical protein KDC57_20435 [Saprospiraceae bacterium]|nr:hypothetical protein [Saprospiraceae bacterium]
MSIKSLLIGAFTVAVFMFFIDFMYYGAFHFLAPIPGVLRDMPDFIFLSIGYLIFGLFFTYFAGKYSERIGTLSQGFIYGLLVGFMVYGLTILNRYATEKIDLFLMMSNLVFNILKVGAAGAVLVLVIRPSRWGKKPPN